jgi:transcription-repair coupling factor (superfamily II helicase)
VECLSRFRTGSQQRRALDALAEGGLDIIVGTHRLLSRDVQFKDLGLVIIDEEQRFGVEHKEKLKQVRATVHVLTLSATPIPRTLHLALLGLRDISNLETPPPDRLPIETRITRFDKTMIRQAVLRELNREGQVYFVHNRVHNIHEIAAKVHDIVPEARLVIGHGQMHGHELEEAMLKFVRREADVLVATTIIESGLDIPNANTMFINQADTYGLADLHQLRGRVGREKNRAYAYLLVDENKLVTPQAAARLKAIEEFTQLGAGFQIAMRDLEIRGAGNILGTQQSGHIAAVGYEMYCQLLENAVRHLRNQPSKTHLEVTIDLPWPAFLPREYVPGQKLRVEVYRRLSRIRNLKKLDDFRQELRDRFGPVPGPAEWMLKLAELRLLAGRWQISSVHRDGADLVFAYRSEKLAKKLAERSDGRMKVIDEKHVYCRLKLGEDDVESLYRLLRHLLRLPNESV